jgi:hypothetical protein
MKRTGNAISIITSKEGEKIQGGNKEEVFAFLLLASALLVPRRGPRVPKRGGGRTPSFLSKDLDSS